MAAFAANLFSDIAALRSFGVEAALGILSAFLLTGMWVPLIRLSVDDWMEKRNKKNLNNESSHMIPEHWLKNLTATCGKVKPALIIAIIATCNNRSCRHWNVTTRR
jgi:predicted RND superfamily exporter protein